ncbi:MAG: TRAP transporter substrate-binding protein DctP, partial [Pseudomonadota bacterium]
MFKKWSFFTAILACCLAISFLSARPAQAERYRWKVATLAPKQVGWALTWQNLVTPWLDRATNSQVVIKVYWGGVMGNDDDYIRKMHIGQLHGAGVTGVGANLACPEFSVVGLPF